MDCKYKIVYLLHWCKVLWPIFDVRVVSLQSNQQPEAERNCRPGAAMCQL